MEGYLEAVHEVEDYLDRPLKGVADYRGVPYRFCSVGWVSPPHGGRAEWDAWQGAVLDRWDPDDDRYELVPTTDPRAVPIWTRATFVGVEPGVELPDGRLPTLRVCWRPIPIQERLDRILEAQPGSGPDGLLNTPAYICICFYLVPADLKQVMPDLRPRDPGVPDVGELGRYGGVAVFPADARRSDHSCGFFQGVWFRYVSMDFVN